MGKKSKKDKEDNPEEEIENAENVEEQKEKKSKKKKSKDRDEEEEEEEVNEKKSKKKSKDNDKDKEEEDQEEEESSKKKKKKSKDKDNDDEADEDEDKENKKKKKKKDKDKEKDEDEEVDEEKEAKKKKKKSKEKEKEEEPKNEDEEEEDTKPKKDKKKKKDKDKEEEEPEREDSASSKKKKKKKDKDEEKDEDKEEEETPKKDKKKKSKDKDKDKEENADDIRQSQASLKSASSQQSKGSAKSSGSRASKTPKFRENFETSKLFLALATINDNTLETVVDLVDGDTPKVDVNTKGDYNETYLHVLAAPRSDEEVNKIIPILYRLMAGGIDVNAQDKESNTALHMCALNDVHHSIANTLIKLGTDPCLLNMDDQDAMDVAANDKLKSVLAYFDPGIWRAVEEKNEEAVKILIDSWCVVDIEKDGKSLVQLAEESGNEFINEYILKNRASIRMCHAAMSGNNELLRQIIKSDEEIDYDLKDWSFLRDDGERTPWPLLAELIRLGLQETAILLMRRADVNVMVEPRKDIRMPLFLWAIRYTKTPDIIFLKALLKRADLTLLDDPIELLYNAWKSDMPADVVEMFTKQGISFIQRDQKGYTLRDKIFMDTYTKDMNTLKMHLYWVDQHVLEMAKAGDKQGLENMLLEGYEYVLVSDMKGKTTYNYAKKAKQKECAKWIKEVPEITRNIFTLQKAIEHGNLQDTKKYIEGYDSMERARDKGGRSPLHLAILFERRFIIKFLVRQYPHSIHYTDISVDIALHQLGRLRRLLRSN